MEDGSRRRRFGLLDRIWIDQLPGDPERTTGNALVVVRAADGRLPIGVSNTRGAFEIFNFKATGNELHVVYPQTDRKEKITARAWNCRERDMDYCLDGAEWFDPGREAATARGVAGRFDESTQLEQVLSRVESIVRLHATNATHVTVQARQTRLTAVPRACRWTEVAHEFGAVMQRGAADVCGGVGIRDGLLRLSVRVVQAVPTASRGGALHRHPRGVSEADFARRPVEGDLGRASRTRDQPVAPS